MEQKDLSPSYHEILKWYINLPNQILAMPERENITEFVLHALCNEQCYNLEKAAYFIDNEDFNCVKGIAGYHRQEEFSDPLTIWSAPDKFSDHMRSCVFNQKVRSIELNSFKKSKLSQGAIVSQLAENLEFSNPTFFKWNVKYDNEGILLFQVNSESSKCESELLKGLCLLGFCPVF